MTIAAILEILSKIPVSVSSAWPFIKKNWKNILLIGFIVWIIVCCLSHCRYVSPWDEHARNIDTVSVRIDSVWVFPDTNAIFVMYGFDTLPRYTHELEQRKRFRPEGIPVLPYSNCRDSLSAYSVLLANANLKIVECDEEYANATSVRGYDSKLRNDSIEVSVTFDVSGELVSEPKISYRNFAKTLQVNKETVLKETVVIGPFRKIGLGGDVGPNYDIHKEFKAIEINLMLGYMDKKNNEFRIKGGYDSSNEWGVMAGYTKWFNVGK